MIHAAALAATIAIAPAIYCLTEATGPPLLLPLRRSRFPPALRPPLLQGPARRTGLGDSSPLRRSRQALPLSASLQF